MECIDLKAKLAKVELERDELKAQCVALQNRLSLAQEELITLKQSVNCSSSGRRNEVHVQTLDFGDSKAASNNVTEVEVVIDQVQKKRRRAPYKPTTLDDPDEIYENGNGSSKRTRSRMQD